MSEVHRIAGGPEKCGGRPVIRGLRIRVKEVLDLLAGQGFPHNLFRLGTRRDTRRTCVGRASIRPDIPRLAVPDVIVLFMALVLELRLLLRLRAPVVRHSRPFFRSDHAVIRFH